MSAARSTWLCAAALVAAVALTMGQAVTTGVLDLYGIYPSGDPARLKAAHALAQYLTGSKVAQEVPGYQLAPGLRRGLLVEAVPPDWLVRCRRLRASALHADHRHLDPACVTAAREAGLWVVTYTVNDPGRAATLFEWGVDCVITDRPDIVRPPRR